MKPQNKNDGNVKASRHDDKMGRFALGCFLIVVPYLCSQSFLCDVLEWIGTDRVFVLGIQVAGAILFSTFSVLLTKDFNLFYGWLTKHRIIKAIVGFMFYCNYKIAWRIYGIVLKTIFLIGKYPEEFIEIDDAVNKKIDEYKKGSALIKAGTSATLIAAEGYIAIMIWGSISYESAVIASHVLSFLASLMGLIVIISATWKYVWDEED